MKLIKIILFYFCFSSYAFGQINSIQTAELDSLYAKALNNRLDLILASGWSYLEKDNFGIRIKKLNISDRFKFRTKDELINLSINNEIVYVVKMEHKIIAKDTIDINFRDIIFKNGILFKTSELKKLSKETDIYKPDIRFVYEKKENEWKVIINRFISKTE